MDGNEKEAGAKVFIEMPSCKSPKMNNLIGHKFHNKDFCRTLNP